MLSIISKIRRNAAVDLLQHKALMHCFFFFTRLSRHVGQNRARTYAHCHARFPRGLHLGVYPPFPQERDPYLKARTR